VTIHDLKKYSRRERPINKNLMGTLLSFLSIKDCCICLWQLIDTKELPLLQAVSPVVQKRSKSNSLY
jgi:hypothetical protein